MILRTKVLEISGAEYNEYKNALFTDAVVTLPCGTYLIDSIDPIFCGYKVNLREILIGVMPESKPLTRTEYVLIERESTCVWDLKEMLESDELFLKRIDGEYSLYSSKRPNLVLSKFLEGDLYRKVEKEITWYEDAINYAKSCRGINDAIYSKEDDSIDIDGSMTRQECNEYAKLLLENC